MRVGGLRAAGFVLLAALAGCAPDPGTGPRELVWDREPCERCRMAISDRQHAAEVRIADDRRVRAFDDLGCALLWLDEHGMRPVEIFVRSRDGDRWLDGSELHYEGGRHTPMGYGFGAAASGAPGRTLEEVWAEVRAMEDERRDGRR